MTTTIQRTSKGVKLLQAAGWLLFLAGLWRLFGEHDHDVAPALIVLGFFTVIIARIARWWVNG
jgi:hypothetical protein